MLRRAYFSRDMSLATRRVKDCKSSSPYLQYASNITSQGGEDGVLRVLFNDIGVIESGYCVDIGAWDGKHLSNTYNLIHNYSWSGLLIEADSDRHREMSILYQSRADVSCICALVDIDGDYGLKSILIKQNVPQEFDFLSIDVDGADYHLWDSLKDYFSPKIVCIEFNPTIPNDVIFIQERDIRIQKGSSLLALKELAESNGYILVVTTLFNAIFIRQKYLPKLRLSLPTELNDFHSSSMITEMFQCYDGNKKWCITTIANIIILVDMFLLHYCFTGELKFVGPRKLM